MNKIMAEKIENAKAALEAHDTRQAELRAISLEHGKQIPIDEAELKLLEGEEKKLNDSLVDADIEGRTGEMSEIRKAIAKCKGKIEELASKIAERQRRKQNADDELAGAKENREPLEIAWAAANFEACLSHFNNAALSFARALAEILPFARQALKTGFINSAPEKITTFSPDGLKIIWSKFNGLVE
jgi:hypothetical protein